MLFYYLIKISNKKFRNRYNWRVYNEVFMHKGFKNRRNK